MNLPTLSLAALFLAGCLSAVHAEEPIDLGARLELFVDSHLIDRLSGGARRQLHHPVAREVAIVMDQPWEGNAVNYVTAFQDGPRYRLYYRGADVKYNKTGYRESHPDLYCYAESTDGIHWTKPTLGLFAFQGSKENNIVWDGHGIGNHNFTPFKDRNPNAAAGAQYKALGVGGSGADRGLYAFKSADAIHWTLLADKPVITKGAFDSQNLAFWDSVRHEYREYHRDFRDGRDIRTCTSKDFLHWTDPVFLDYSPNRVSQLYTNQIIPYYRNPHLFLGFPTRYVDRGWTKSAEALPRYAYRRIRGAKSPREGTAVTDTMLITSRDGRRFDVWPESFIRPGLRTTDSWFYGDVYQNWGLVETKSSLPDGPPELSVYVTESTMQERTAYLRRYTLRVDGFVAVTAPLAGGELVTKPFRFRGRRLLLNYSTSAAGSLRIEVQDASGTPIPGFELDTAPDIYGDAIAQVAPWKEGSALAPLAGQTIRLRIVLRDADLYSLRFAD